MAIPLRLDPAQHFTCGSCARCCRRLEIIVSQEEVETLRRRRAAQWFRDTASAEGTGHDPFMPIPGPGGFHRIRRRDDGACGFLSSGNRCRIHEELGSAHKPLTCRVFPYRFHPAPEAVIVSTSFSCPTIVANEGDRIASSTTFAAIEKLKDEWFSTQRPTAPPRELVRGRPIATASVTVLRESLLALLHRQDAGEWDLRSNLRRIAVVLDDLSRSRVLRLADADFAEYVRLTVPYAAAAATPAPERPPTRVGRLLQRGFLFVVAAARLRLENPGMPRLTLRLKVIKLLAHIHGLAPPGDGVNMAAVKQQRLDLNAPDVRPVAVNYLRSQFEAIGVTERPLLDHLAVAVALLNAASALAAMQGQAGTLAKALPEAADLSHLDERSLIGRALSRLAGGSEAFYTAAH